MKIACIADDDLLVGQGARETVDLLISLGDLWDSTLQRATEWYKPRQVLAVRGNHDSAGPFPSGVRDLHLATVEFEGLRLGGFAGSWRYKPRGHHLFDQDEVSGLLRDFPAVDVFVAHNSPFGIHERDGDVHQGFEAFVEYIQRHRPRRFIHGHQHVNRTSVFGDTTVLGVYGEHLIEW
jgi:Icc-related predicted phosphoesterase